MSASSSDLSASGGKKQTVAQLVDRLRDKTATERFSLLAHLSVGRTLCRLRDAIANGEEVNRKAAMTLLCCGISLYRRHTLGNQEEEDEDTEEMNALIKRTAVLIFVLLAAIEASRGDRVDVDNARDVVAAASAATLANVLKVHRRKRKAPEAEEGPDPEEAEKAEAWARVLTVSSGELTLSVLQFVSHTIGQSAATDHETLADLFFRNSAACMAHKMLLRGGDGDFVSLKAAAANPIPREKRLLALAQAGESEAGQSILRDLLLSFLLPSGVVGVRRHLLMSRAASTAAGVDHADAVNTGHSVACAQAFRTKRALGDTHTRARARATSPLPPPNSLHVAQDGGFRVHLAALQGRAGARVRAARGRGHPDDARWPRPHPQARRLLGPGEPALF